MQQDTQIRDELYQFESTNADLTETDISTGQTSLWLQGWRYQVPVGQSYVFEREHTFSFYGEDLTTTELTVADLFRIRVEDPSHTDSKLILGPLRYTQVAEFQDETKKAHFDVLQPVIAKENWFIIIEAYASISLDASLCYWTMTCNRIRSAIF